jgi:hypothetical protein
MDQTRPEAHMSSAGLGAAVEYQVADTARIEVDAFLPSVTDPLRLTAVGEIWSNTSGSRLFTRLSMPTQHTILAL